VFSSLKPTGAGFALLFFQTTNLAIARLLKSVINLLHDAATGRDVMSSQINERANQLIGFSCGFPSRHFCAATGACRLNEGTFSNP
jgi:hypothetical protein